MYLHVHGTRWRTDHVIISSQHVTVRHGWQTGYCLSNMPRVLCCIGMPMYFKEVVFVAPEHPLIFWPREETIMCWALQRAEPIWQLNSQFLLDPPSIASLAVLPCVLMNEEQGDPVSKVGYICYSWYCSHGIDALKISNIWSPWVWFRNLERCVMLPPVTIFLALVCLAALRTRLTAVMQLHTLPIQQRFQPIDIHYLLKPSPSPNFLEHYFF